jgi:hypothetical protein
MVLEHFQQGKLDVWSFSGGKLQLLVILPYSNANLD